VSSSTYRKKWVIREEDIELLRVIYNITNICFFSSDFVMGVFSSFLMLIVTEFLQLSLNVRLFQTL